MCAVLLQASLSHPCPPSHPPLNSHGALTRRTVRRNVGSDSGGWTLQPVLLTMVVAPLFLVLPPHWLWLNLILIFWESRKGKTDLSTWSRIIKLVCFLSCWRYELGNFRTFGTFLSLMEHIFSAALQAEQKEAGVKNPQAVIGEMG